MAPMGQGRARRVRCLRHFGHPPQRLGVIRPGFQRKRQFVQRFAGAAEGQQAARAAGQSFREGRILRADAGPEGGRFLMLAQGGGDSGQDQQGTRVAGAVAQRGAGQALGRLELLLGEVHARADRQQIGVTRIIQQPRFQQPRRLGEVPLALGFAGGLEDVAARQARRARAGQGGHHHLAQQPSLLRHARFGLVPLGPGAAQGE